MLLGFQDLRYVDKKTLEFIQSNKQKLIDTPLRDAIEQGIAKRNFHSMLGYNKIRNMALAFDAFMALAND